MTGDPKVASIPPGAPYLPTLVDALLSGHLIDGFAPGNDPLSLASVTIWVPTRRAARALATEFVSRVDANAALLPQIRALGDVDVEELYFEQGDGATDLQSTISSMERQLILARLINGWASSLNAAQRNLIGGDDILMPSSTADAVAFAADLARLMDMVATEEADWQGLQTLVPDDHADWWKLTLEFLKIATAQWPAILAERNLVESARLRASHLRQQANAYETSQPAGPVIAAGSTGSIPATADLLKTIAHMQQGLVVLPGLDRDLDDETWAKVDLPDNDRDDSGTTPGHPQYGLKRLIDHIGILRADVRQIGGIDDSSAGHARVREKLISEALRPAASTDRWQENFGAFSVEQRCKAFDGVTIIAASGEREEALAIALSLRETLEQAKKTAALVTPDRNLARRVAVEMRRFGIDVDDSAGQPLRNRPPGTFARLVLQVAFLQPDPIALVALLKHPLARFGGAAEHARRSAHLFELGVLRGAIIAPRAGEFEKKANEARQIWSANLRTRADGSAPQRQNRSVARFLETDWDDVVALAIRLDQIFTDHPMSGEQSYPVGELARRSVQFIEACGVAEDNSLVDLYGTPEGQSLHEFLAELIDQSDTLDVEAAQWPDVFDSLLVSKVTRLVSGSHPRVSILGPLEARLQTFDRVVLGGLNEKTWPVVSRNDPFLSRPMKSVLGLPPPERRTGLAAHDFQVMLGIHDVVLTRSAKADNAPTVASRWLQRLAMVAGNEAVSHMEARGKKYLDWVAAIDDPGHRPQPCRQPRPAPPAEVRPRSLSVTEIETWIRDPYAIYARRILKLDALEPLIREADARERGVLYHDILDGFLQSGIDHESDSALPEFLKLARIHFDAAEVPEEIAALWWPRFKTIAASFLSWHRNYALAVSQIYSELDGRTDVGLHGFTLRGRADRIDLFKDGRLGILDYKTGVSPYLSEVRKLDAPQLPLEAAMAKRGAFGEELRADAASFTYVRLRPAEEFKVEDLDKESIASELAEEAWTKLEELIRAYSDPAKPYVSKARTARSREWISDYDHLARVLEWSTAEQGEDG